MDGRSKKDSFINWKNDSVNRGMTMLFMAVYRHNLYIATFLLDNGADVNIANNDGETPLMHAAKYKQTETVELLLDRGADTVRTALMKASVDCSWISEPETAKLLVERGADITTTDEDGWTALMHASYSGQSETANILIDKGADITIVDRNGKNALILACEQGRLEVSKLLLDNGADQNIRDSEGRTALHWACTQSWNLKLVKLLLGRGADASIEATNRETPLQVASERNHREIVWFLVRQYPNLVSE